MSGRQSVSVAAALVVLVFLSAASVSEAADDFLYILPQWTLSGTDDEIESQVERLRTVIGEGSYVRVGFTVYIHISMTDWSVDVDDRAAVRAALADTIAQINTAVNRARHHGIPICLSFLTAIRERYDPVQSASELEDRRNMQWYNDGQLAGGWWTYSRYARKIRAVQEAYIRELAAIVADLMRRYPDTLVAASGDGEVELSRDRSPPLQPDLTPETSSFADYSPFAVLEFRDWIRAEGLYATGQTFAGQAYKQASRYTGDISPAVDTNGDGHTLNGDFGLSIQNWNLRYGHWLLNDDVNADPNAIPAAVYNLPGWTLPDVGANRFDAPRVRKPGNSWWELWMEFREQTIWRHNLDFARWMTTSPDETGAVIPPTRWYSDQIPADYLFGHSPASKDLRLETSASPWWTADVAPYGSVGITAFNANLENGSFARTLAGVVPHIAARNRRWGILEWNPSIPTSDSIDIYREEMTLIERYRPNLLVPFKWGTGYYGIEGTPFETALKELIGRIKDGFGALAVSTPTVRFGGVMNGGTLTSVTAAQDVTVTQSGGTPAKWTATANQPWVQITSGAGTGTGQFTVRVTNASGLPSSGAVTATVSVSSTTITNSPVELTLLLTLQPGGTTAAPVGFFDAPVDGSTGMTGSVGVSGWAVDDVGVAGVKIYRNCMSGIDAPGSCQTVDGYSVAFLGDAAFLAGARSDVEAAYPTYPASYRAGWGLLVLTNMLPHVPTRNPAGGGQGPVTFYAFATDLEGHRVLLGTKTITLDNDRASTPFGAIDTPGQGATVSGLYTNFGWALTPGTAMIPTDGSTMRVVLDGVRVGTVNYNFCRGSVGIRPAPGTCDDDVAQLFPTLTNIRTASGAIGYFQIDTTTLTNGLHTLAWGVIDNQGRATGVGSRFFLVLNGSEGTSVGGTSAGVAAAPRSAAARAAVAELADAPAQVLGTTAEVAWRATSAGRVWGRTGFDFDAPYEELYADAAGVRQVTVPEFGRLELWLGPTVEGGYLQANGTLRVLPPGSRFEPTGGVFTWAPGPGYLGTYELVFLEGATQIPVQVTVRPKADLPPGLMRGYIDLPSPNTIVSGAFRVAGWALDLGAWQGGGVGAVHVWAQRRDMAAAVPVFLGSAEMAGSRPDVGQQFGPQFDRAGWSLRAAGLPAGSYTLTAYFWSTRTQRFEDARTATITVR